MTLAANAPLCTVNNVIPLLNQACHILFEDDSVINSWLSRYHENKKTNPSLQRGSCHEECVTHHSFWKDNSWGSSEIYRSVLLKRCYSIPIFWQDSSRIGHSAQIRRRRVLKRWSSESISVATVIRNILVIGSEKTIVGIHLCSEGDMKICVHWFRKHDSIRYISSYQGSCH